MDGRVSWYLISIGLPHYGGDSPKPSVGSGFSIALVAGQVSLDFFLFFLQTDGMHFKVALPRLCVCRNTRAGISCADLQSSHLMLILC